MRIIDHVAITHEKRKLHNGVSRMHNDSYIIPTDNIASP